MKNMLVSVLLLPLFAAAQKKDTIIRYLDEQLQLTTSKNAVYAGVSVKTEGGWYFYALYPDTTPLVKAYFKDRALKTKEGPYTIYYPGNQKAREGHYRNNVMVGVWKFWHPNGRLQDSGLIINNHTEGNWKSWHPNGQLQVDCHYREARLPQEKNLLAMQTDAATAPPYRGIRTGTYRSWYTTGQLEAEGAFEHNYMSGTWRWYHENGQPSAVEVYADGIITGLTCFDTTGRETGNLCSISKPALLKGFGDYKSFVYEHLTWPEEAIKKKIEGSVHVRFRVSRQGRLEKLVVESAQPLLKQAVIQLFENMPDWYPAISHNRTIHWDGEITIPFYRNN